MMILFNAYVSSIANNGGSKSIVKSAEALVKLGHETVIMTRVNHYTWSEIKTNVVYGEVLPYQFDVVVNVSVMDVDHTLKMPIENKIWWLRAWPVWVKGEEYLIKTIKMFVIAGGRMIVNATHLKDKLEKIGVESTVCFAGLDLEFWNDEFTLEDIDSGLVIGGCKYERHATKNSDIVSKYANYPMSIKQNMDNAKLQDYYADCHIWLAPTILEGFHQSPAEANLCGCLVVCNRNPSNGIGDYGTDETAMRYDNIEELETCLKNPDFDKVARMQTLLKIKIGSREKCMKRFVEVIG